MKIVSVPEGAEITRIVHMQGADIVYYKSEGNTWQVRIRKDKKQPCANENSKPVKRARGEKRVPLGYITNLLSGYCDAYSRNCHGCFVYEKECPGFWSFNKEEMLRTIYRRLSALGEI